MQFPETKKGGPPLPSSAKSINNTTKNTNQMVKRSRTKGGHGRRG